MDELSVYYFDVSHAISLHDWIIQETGMGMSDLK